MKTLKDYPVTLDYNATALPWYTPLNRHKGRDYGAPLGTPVQILSKVIGLVGSTGLSSGAHGHCAKWVSLIANFLGFPRGYKDPADIFKTGGRVVYAGWFGTAGNAVIWKDVRTDGKRVFYMVCHLSEIKVKRNDWIK